MEQGAFNQTALNGKDYADWVAREEARHVLLMKDAGFMAGQQVTCAQAGNRARGSGWRRAQQGRAALRQKSAEIAVAALFFLLGAIVVFDSVRLGAAGRTTGRRPGYFPVLHRPAHLRLGRWSTSGRGAGCRGDGDKAFVEVGQLKLVLAVLVPTRGLRRARSTGSGIYVASVAVHRLLHALAGQVRLVEGGRGQRRQQRGLLPDVRDLVQGSAAQGTARSPGWAWAEGWKRSSR